MSRYGPLRCIHSVHLLSRHRFCFFQKYFLIKNEIEELQKVRHMGCCRCVFITFVVMSLTPLTTCERLRAKPIGSNGTAAWADCGAIIGNICFMLLTLLVAVSH